MGFWKYIFLVLNHKYSSFGRMVPWLAVSFVPDMDAPTNLGFGSTSAPRKRLKCCQVVEWTKHKAMIPVNVVITVFAHFFLFFLGFWSLCPPFILPSGVHIECSMCAQPASKEVKWQTINWFLLHMYCNWGSQFALITVLKIYIKCQMTKPISSLSWEPPLLVAARKTTMAAG